MKWGNSSKKPAVEKAKNLDFVASSDLKSL
jgi:hypothetical protein